MEPTTNLQEASTFGEVALNIPRINDALEDHQVEYQPTMVEFECKLANDHISILIYPGASLNYINPKVV